MRFDKDAKINAAGRRLWLAGALLLGSLVGTAAVMPGPVRGQDPAPVAVTPQATVTAPDRETGDKAGEAGSETTAVLKQATEALRQSRHADAARLLRSLKVSRLAPNEARRWRSLASLAALRTGDRKWADEINNDPEHFSNTLNLVTATAARMLQDGQYDEARALLSQIKNPEGLDEIPRRRYLQLYARLEQLTGHPESERVYVAKLVDFAGKWSSATCQACHANTKLHGDAVTSLNVSDWWVGDRMTALLKQGGDADRVRKDAEARLAKDPNDAGARLRLAYALRAAGDAAGADAALQTLPWADLPGRERKAPLRLATFP